MAVATEPAELAQMSLAIADGQEETAVIAGPSKKGPWQKFVSFIWDPDYYEKSDAERRLVFKLDCFMLASLTIGWWLKNIDQSNLANAYVSGMKEDLNITGNQYTYMGTIYNAVICAMCIPANFIVMKVRPAWFLASCEIGWGIFTFAQAGARSYQAMYGFRFCVALFESFYYPIGFFILGSWYTRKEIAKRIGLWFVAGPAGSAFSGYLQAAIYSNLNGLHGLAGWRWLYIICGIMTVPCGVLLYFLVPDFPENTKVWYLTQAEVELARERCRINNIKPVVNKIEWSYVGRSVKAWRFWILVPWYLIYGLAVQNGAQFAVYLKAAGYSVTMRNVLPSCMYIIEIPTLLFYTYISDRYGHRFLVCLIPLIWGLIPTGILAVWPSSNSLKVFAFIVNQSIYVTPVFYAWVSEICRNSPEERAFIVGATSCLFYCFNAWLPTIIFLQTDGPSFRKGFPTNFAFTIVSLLGVVVIYLFHRRQLRQEDAADGKVPSLEGGPVQNYEGKEGSEAETESK